jgi:hypothetical protein
VITIPELVGIYHVLDFQQEVLFFMATMAKVVLKQEKAVVVVRGKAEQQKSKQVEVRR